MTIRAHWLMLMAACLAFAPHVAAHAQGSNAAQVQADDDDDDDDAEEAPAAAAPAAPGGAGNAQMPASAMSADALGLPPLSGDAAAGG